jgi:hypothetical protein
LRVWLLNLDAEIELARPGPYQTERRIASLLAPWAERARGLLAPGDQLLEDWLQAPEREREPAGACWSPTPSALARLTKAGVRAPPSPTPEVLRRVCHRRFYLELGGGAPGARYFEQLDPLLAALDSPRQGSWLFKRPFSFAGRGQRRLRAALSADDQRWLADSLRQGGLLGEPWLEIERELSQHGQLTRAGQLTLGRPCWQRTDQQRAWLASEPVAPGELNEGWRRALASAAERAAEALFRAGYFGPFGIDAYLWRDAGGGLVLNPLSELNARYSMGYAAGMAAAGS